MTVVSAFLVPGSPLPYVRGDNPPWKVLRDAMARAAGALADSGAETIVVYSTQWIAVLDQLWQTRPRVSGIHVDENWHEHGELRYDIRIDTALTGAVIDATPALDLRAKGVDYDGFPVDTGTIVAANLLNPEGALAMALTSNNVYHDWETTRALGALVARQAEALGRRIAIVGVGGLSGTIFRHTIAEDEDRIGSDADDAWNRDILSMMERGDAAGLVEACPRYAQEARVDMGFKHFAFVLGGMDGAFAGATVHGYGPLYGAGGAVVEFDVR